MYFTSYKPETRDTIKRIQAHLMSCTRSSTNKLEHEQKAVMFEREKIAKYFSSPFHKDENPA